MPNKRIPVAEATATQLRWHAENILGIAMSRNPATKAETILEKIREDGWAQDFIFVAPEGEDTFEPALKGEEAARAEGQSASPPFVQEKGLDNRLDTDSSKDPRVTVTVHRHRDAGGNRPVPVMINGVNMLIPRGVKSVIPYRYYLGLVDAMKTEHEQVDGEGRNQGDIEARDVPAYPFSTDVMPSVAEIRHWYQRRGARVPDELLAA